MEAGLNSFRQRLATPWLTDPAAQSVLAAHFESLVCRLQDLPAGAFPVIACEQSEAVLAAVLAALACGRDAFLGNPAWTPAENAAARSLIGAEQFWLTTDVSGQLQMLRVAATNDERSSGGKDSASNQFTGDSVISPVASPVAICAVSPAAISSTGFAVTSAASEPPSSYLMIPTGGTGGTLKFARHNWQTLHAATTGYAAFWQTQAVNCVCALPVYHVGGLMLALRTFITGGRLCLLPWADLQQLALEDSGEPLPDLQPFADDWHISLVPTQVQRLLASPAAVCWLQRMQAVLIGGGASHAPLLRAAAAARIPLCPAYGMTETAATIALQPPAEFFASYGRAADAATSAVSGTDAAADVAGAAGTDDTAGSLAIEESLPPPQGTLLPHLSATLEQGTARILLSGDSLFHGYYPQPAQPANPFATGDAGVLDAGGRRLSVTGRLDRIVVSGGKKIDPQLVEQVIAAQARRLGIVLDAVLVTGVGDAEWGQRLIALIVPAALSQQGAAAESPLCGLAGVAAPAVSEAQAQSLRGALSGLLPAYQRPKQWLWLRSLPLDARGKPDRARIAMLAAANGE